MLNSIKELEFHFFRPKFKHPICPLAFANISIKKLTIRNMINTFYKRNLIKFESDVNIAMDLGCNVEYAVFSENENIEMNRKILDKHVFKNVKIFAFFGDVVSIDSGVLKPFKNLSRIIISSISMKKIFNRGIDWMWDLNEGIRIDFSNKSALLLLRKISLEKRPVLIDNIYIYEKRLDSYQDMKIFNSAQLVPNEDFCIFRNFPFERMVIFMLENFNNMETCTLLWLEQYFYVYSLVLDPILDETLLVMIEYRINTSFKQIIKCDFKKM